MAVLHDVVLIAAPAGLAATSAATWYFRRAATRANQALHASRSQTSSLAREIEVRDQEAGHLSAVRLPAFMAAPGSGDLTQAGQLLHPQLASTSFGRALQAALRQTADFARDAENRAEESAHAQVKDLLRPLLTLAAHQQSEMVRVLGKVADEEVLAHAFAVDHAATLLSQRMHIIGILMGDEVSSRRPDLPLMEVLGGAQSRVQDYQRVEVTNTRSDFVWGRVAEPIAIALAELMDNGARHSTPASQVSVWTTAVQGGLTVVVDSLGPMLSPDGYERAAAVLPGQYRLPLAVLGTQLGLPAVGVLARRHGFQAWLDPNHQGGVRAVLHLPERLLRRPPVLDEPQHHSASGDETATKAAPAGTGLRTDSPRGEVGFASHGLRANAMAVRGAAGANHHGAGGRPLELHARGER
ncbi:MULTISPECIES: hypothetical protein [Streptomyces]|uniref:hypothetical protein n=1 Tax=Streptomyces TaxID=1883 RepID=UPI0036DAB1C4|nr:hypothetical protein OG509_32915 [Streptomyces sp. NBC_01006]